MLDHVVFLVSGWAMTSATQLETYWGGNRDVGMLLGLFQYLGMAALIFLPAGGASGKWRHARCTHSAEPSIIDIISPERVLLHGLP